jgi:hypothetical protein
VFTDADRMPYGCDSFDTCPVGDRDIMSDEHEMACGTPRCGGSRMEEWGRESGCPGCRHCDPVSHEDKPYGWGIERGECDAAIRLLWELRSHALLGLVYDAAGHDFFGPSNFARALAWVGFDSRRERCSDRVWDKLCCECETHREAVAKYTAWADKVTKKAK